MKILKKEVVYLSEKEEEAIDLLKQLCSAISNQSITYELAQVANNIHHYLTIFSEDWIEEDLSNTCSDYDDDDDEEDNALWYDFDDEDDEDEDDEYYYYDEDDDKEKIMIKRR